MKKNNNYKENDGAWTYVLMMSLKITICYMIALYFYKAYFQHLDWNMVVIDIWFFLSVRFIGINIELFYFLFGFVSFVLYVHKVFYANKR